MVNNGQNLVNVVCECPLTSNQALMAWFLEIPAGSLKTHNPGDPKQCFSFETLGFGFSQSLLFLILAYVLLCTLNYLINGQDRINHQVTVAIR